MRLARKMHPTVDVAIAVSFGTTAFETRSGSEKEPHVQVVFSWNFSPADSIRCNVFIIA